MNKFKVVPNKRIFLTTGPSMYSPEIKSMVENYFGGIPVYVNNKVEDIDYFLDQANVVIGAGGSDIFPGFLGRDVICNASYSKFDIRRDIAETYLFEQAIERKIPCLLICRGFQLAMAKIFGFRLHPDLPGNVCHSKGDIKIDVENGEFLHYTTCLSEYKDIYFDKEGSYSAHHQGIVFNSEREKNGINVVATADTNISSKDNLKIIEIAESEKLKLVMTQNHPEVDYKYGNIVSNKILERFKSFL